MTRWWVVLCVSVLWDTASLEPSDNGQTQRECCPCPKDAFGNSLARSDSLGADSDALASDAVALGTTGGVRAALGPVGDCPCRFRDADSEGAPSMFFPTALRAVRPFVSLEDSKENPDPLLHPEVNLASSVLETLRKATDEEYEDALARDAARSASDGEAAESARNLVTVIINPKDAAISDDDVMAEASHAHEARCINPSLGRTSFRSGYKPSILLTDILNLPSRKPMSARSWSLFDMDNGVGASEVNEQVVEPNFKDKKLDLTPSVLRNTKTKPKNALDKLQLRIPTFSNNLNSERLSSNSDQSLLPKLRTQSKIENPGMSNLLPKLHIPNLLRRNKDDDVNDNTVDSQNAASIIKERYTGFVSDSRNDGDVKTKTAEIIPKSIFKSSSKIIPTERRDASTDWLNNILRGLEVPNLNSWFSPDMFNLRNNEQATKSTEIREDIIPKKKQYVTEILDTVPSPSEIKSDHISFDEVENKGGINENMNNKEDETQKIVEQNPMKIEILDHLPNFTDDNKINNMQASTIADTNIEPKSNSFAGDNSELNNETGEIDEDVVEDTIISASNGKSNFETANFSEGIAERPDVSSFMFDKTGTENDGTTRDESVMESNIEESTSSNEDFKERNNVGTRLSLREKIRNSLENIKGISKSKGKKSNTIDEPKITDSESFDFNDEDMTSESQDTESEKVRTEILDSLPSKENIDQVNIDDIQQMSDSLLDEENERIDSLAEANDVKVDKIGINEADDLLDNKNDKIDRDLMENSKKTEKNLANKEMVCFDVSSGKSLADIESELNAKNNEMAIEASDRVIETVDFNDNLQSTLRQNSILQPPSLSDLNLLNLPTLDLSNAINIKNPLPVLKLTDMFNVRESFDDTSSSEDSLDAKQSTSASTSSFRSVLPPLVQPLEDINLDILQLKPLGTALPAIPRLNLNSFKTRLAIPESLQLKPVLLESSVGNKKGVFGASISLGNDKNGIGRSSMLQEASLKKPTILGSPLGSLPSLDELRSTMWENAQNLFNTPLETTGKNVFEDTLRSGQVLTENFRVGAENTVKDIQRNLESTFKGVGLNNHGFLSSASLGSPSDLFDEISRRHDDVNDKLKGIQYDLSDRLETLRNNIFDDYRIPSLGSSIFDGMPMLGSPMPEQSFVKPKSKSSNFSNKSKKVTLSTNSNTSPKGKFISRSSVDKNKLKMPTASSISSPMAIKSPKLRTVESPVLKSFGQEPLKAPIMFPRTNSKSSLSILPKADKKAVEGFFKKPASSLFNQNKVKISFSSTELPPILKSKPSARLKPFGKPKSSSIHSLGLPSLPKSAKEKPGFLSSLRDSSGFASEPIASKVRAPFLERKNLKDLKPLLPKSATMDTDDKEIFDVITTTTRPKINLFTKPKPPTLNKVYENPLAQLSTQRSLKPKSSLISDGTIDKVTSEPLRNKPPLSWPKTIDDKFLSKVREALRARLAGIAQKNNTKISDLFKQGGNAKSDQGETSGDSDMAKSASSNVVAETGPEIMRENESYSCKMMCTKNKL